MMTGSGFRARREQAGLTQQEAAERLGVALRTIGNWERSDVIPARHWQAIEGMFDDEARLDAVYPSVVNIPERGPSWTRDLERVAIAVRDGRLDHGWGKEEAARRAGISSITWKRVEDAERVQDASLAKVLSVLGLSEQELASDAGSRSASHDQHLTQSQISDEVLLNARTIVTLGSRVVKGISELSQDLRRERSPHAAAAMDLLPDALDMWFAGMNISGDIHPIRDAARRDPEIASRLGLGRNDDEQGDYTLAAMDRDDSEEIEAQQNEP